MSVFTPAKSDSRLFVAEMDANGVLTPIFQLAGDDAMTETAYTPAKSDSRLFAAALDALGNLIPVIKSAGLVDAFEDVYVFMGAIATTTAPAISITTLVDTFVGLTLTPAYSGSNGVWTITANLADTFKTTSLIICNRTYSQGVVETGYVRTSDTVLTVTTRGVPGSPSNMNLNNLPLIIITPKA